MCVADKYLLTTRQCCRKKLNVNIMLLWDWRSVSWQHWRVVKYSSASLLLTHLGLECSHVVCKYWKYFFLNYVIRSLWSFDNFEMCSNWKHCIEHYCQSIIYNINWFYFVFDVNQCKIIESFLSFWALINDMASFWTREHSKRHSFYTATSSGR